MAVTAQGELTEEAMLKLTYPNAQFVQTFNTLFCREAAIQRSHKLLDDMEDEWQQKINKEIATGRHAALSRMRRGTAFLVCCCEEGVQRRALELLHKLFFTGVAAATMEGSSVLEVQNILHTAVDTSLIFIDNQPLFLAAYNLLLDDLLAMCAVNSPENHDASPGSRPGSAMGGRPPSRVCTPSGRRMETPQDAVMAAHPTVQKTMQLIRKFECATGLASPATAPREGEGCIGFGSTTATPVPVAFSHRLTSCEQAAQRVLQLPTSTPLALLAVQAGRCLQNAPLRASEYQARRCTAVLAAVQRMKEVFQKVNMDHPTDSYDALLALRQVFRAVARDHAGSIPGGVASQPQEDLNQVLDVIKHQPFNSNFLCCIADCMGWLCSTRSSPELLRRAVGNLRAAGEQSTGTFGLISMARLSPGGLMGWMRRKQYALVRGAAVGCLSTMFPFFDSQTRELVQREAFLPAEADMEIVQQCVQWTHSKQHQRMLLNYSDDDLAAQVKLLEEQQAELKQVKQQLTDQKKELFGAVEEASREVEELERRLQQFEKMLVDEESVLSQLEKGGPSTELATKQAEVQQKRDAMAQNRVYVAQERRRLEGVQKLEGELLEIEQAQRETLEHEAELRKCEIRLHVLDALVSDLKLTSGTGRREPPRTPLSARQGSVVGSGTRGTSPEINASRLGSASDLITEDDLFNFSMHQSAPRPPGGGSSLGSIGNSPRSTPGVSSGSSSTVSSARSHRGAPPTPTASVPNITMEEKQSWLDEIGALTERFSTDCTSARPSSARKRTMAPPPSSLSNGLSGTPRRVGSSPRTARNVLQFD